MQELRYTFKFYYKDGTEEIYDGLYCINPKYLFYDFAGLMDWDNFYKLPKKNNYP